MSKKPTYTPPFLNGARVIQVIETVLDLAGSGKPDDPYRRVTQYWTLDGQLLAQVDPRNPSETKCTLIEEV